MTLPPTLLIRVLPALAVLAAFAGDARAQEQCLGDIDFELWIQDDSDTLVQTATNDVRVTEYFNQARCECAAAGAPGSSFEFRLTANDATVGPAEAVLQVGNNCQGNEIDQRQCLQIDAINNIQDLRSETAYSIPANEFMFPYPEPAGTCVENTGSRNVFVLFDQEGDNLYENYCSLQEAINIDAKPPLPPSNRDLAPAEGAVVITWDLQNADPDIAHFQVLCTRAGESTPVFDEPADEAEYDTTQALCGEAKTYGDDLPDALVDLDASFICGTATSTATSIRIDGLENSVFYDFVLLTVDKARNVSAVYVGEAEPAPAVDFWEDYDSRGGTAEGGVCLVNSTFGGGSGPTQVMRDFRDDTLAHYALGRAIIHAYYDFIAPLGAHVDGSPALRIAAGVVLMPLAGLAAFWEYTSPIIKLLVLLGFMALSGRVRRVVATMLPRAVSLRRAPAMAMAAVLVMAAWTVPAHAQGANDPYWDDFEPIRDTAPVGRSYWNVGIKVGPYTPAIDSEFDLAEGQVGPYEQMFGGSAVMGAIELERFFLWPLGQLGATVSLGWMSKSANAYQTVACSDPPEADCVNGFRVRRENGIPQVSAGDTTGFRMIPASLGVVYRFTELDDRFRVPVVPYGKAGLSYYLWWITQPDGSIAEAPTMDCPDPDDPALDCDGNRALGGSLGWQASLGLAVRAERVDPNAAQSLRNEYGIEHAGVYAELTYAKVDGFGSDSRLSVGGFTWFGGLNFEF